MKEYDLIPAIICLFIYFAANDIAGKILMVVSMTIALIPFIAGAISFYGGIAPPNLFSTQPLWQVLAVLLPLVLQIKQSKAEA